MSINHYSTELPESHHYHRSHLLLMDSSSSPPKQPFNSAAAVGFSWLTPRQLYASAAGPMSFSFNLNTASNDDDDDDLIDDRDASGIGESAETPAKIPKELLFEKPLTPSDVGKLNRLVIPKQHAEKCFPLNGGESGENGLLLSFEDEVGKVWRFRYSYWNSSQSYVLTKGWSRFVKEKRLDAGDVVVFLRHSADAGQLFIGWRRRNSMGAQDHANLTHPPAAAANGGGWNRISYSNSPNPYRSKPQLRPSPRPHGGSDHYPHAGPNVQNQTATTSGSGGNSKRLRLFGVNLECQAAADESEPSTPVGSPMYTYHHHQYQSTHMDATFSGGDAYQQG